VTLRQKSVICINNVFSCRVFLTTWKILIERSLNRPFLVFYLF